MSDRVLVDVLRQTPFRRFWAASTVSGFGTYVTTVALQVLIVVTLDGTATDVGAVTSARWLPYLLLGVVAGVLIERRRRRPVLVVADLGRGLLLLAIPALALADALSIGLLAGFMFVFGVLSLANDAAFQSFLPRVVTRRDVITANARLDQSDALAQTSGPAVGGALVAAVGAPAAVLVDAASYLYSAAMIARIDVVEPAPVTARPGGAFRAELREGLAWVYRHRTLTPLAWGSHLWFLFFSMFTTVFAPFVLRTQHLGELGLGIVLAMAGVGGVVGSSFARGLGHRFGAGRVVIISYTGCALAFTLVALAAAASDGHPQTAGVVLVGAGQLVLGLAMGANNANELGFRQTVTPDRLQARTNATMRSANRTMIVVGAPLGGIIGDAFGYRSTMWLAAAGMLLASAALASSPFRHARVDHDSDEPV